MKKSVKWLSMLCLGAMLLQSCGASQKPAETVPTPETNPPTKIETPVTTPDPIPTDPKEVIISEGELSDKIAGGWIGQMVGVAWAASTEFGYAGVLMPAGNMPTWKPEMINDAFGQDDLYVEIPFLDAMKENGAFCDPKYMAEKFRDSKFALWHANGMGRQNLLNGIPYPMSGNYQYNYHADDIDWQIEADFLGMMYPGLVNAAAERAFEIGHIMNYGDGVYGGVFVSAMHAAAFTADSLEEIWRAGIAVIPEGTQFRELLDDVVASYEAGDSFEKNWKKLETKWASTDICPELPGKSNIDAKLNSGYILLGMLYGEGDLDKTILLSTRCGQDSDCNPSSAASILGNFYGASGLPEKYASGLDYTKTKFSYTNYNFTQTLNLNLSLTKEVLENSGVTKNADGKYVIMADTSYTPVAVEQIPDGVYGYLYVTTKGNTVTVKELTPFSKNEKVVGYTLDMGDGYVFYDAAPASYVYAKSGTYTITLTVTGDKGTKNQIKTMVKASLESGKVNDEIIVCHVGTPMGGGSKNIEIIRDGFIPAVGSSDASKQYDTYILGDPHGNPSNIPAYVGYVYLNGKTVTQIEFTEGGHFGDGGWFKGDTLEVQILKDGKWQSVEYTVSPKNYPTTNGIGAHGKSCETYTFKLNAPTQCDGVRLYGIGGGSKTFISVSELVVK